MRTQKDQDIIRMSALKSAVELVSAYSERLTHNNSIKISDAVIHVAEQFCGWLSSLDYPDAEEAQPQSPHDAQAQWVEEAWKRAEEKTEAAILKAQEEKAARGSAYQNPDKTHLPGGHARITPKQYGFIIALRRELGLPEPDYDKLNVLTCAEASGVLDALLQKREQEKGNGKDALKKVKHDIRERI